MIPHIPNPFRSAAGARLVRFILFAVLAAASQPLSVAAEIYEPNNQKVIFRYRCFSGTQPAWVSTLTSSGGISHAAGSNDIVTIDRGTGFANTIVTDFDGSTEFLQGSATLNTVDGSGDDSFTIEAWFKADSVTGSRTLFSNTESNRGFAMKVNAGRLRGTVRFKDGSSFVSHTLQMEPAYPDLEAGRWYYVVFHVRRTALAYELRLYRDGERVAFYTTPSRWNGVYQSSEKPMVGAEPSGGAASGEYFDGQIYGVVVSNHDVYLDNYVKNKVVRDAGRYFGMPSYHDYLDTRASSDYRLHETTTAYVDAGSKVIDRMQIPFLNDSYIPQGVAYDATTGNFYISYYWKDTAGTTGTYPSVIAEIEKSTHRLRRTFQLKKPDGNWSYGHTHGLGFLNGSLYMPYGTSIHRFDLSSAPNPTYIFNDQTFANPKGDQNPLTPAASYSPNLQTNTAIGCAEISADSNGDQILWMADFDTSAYTKLLGFKIVGGVVSTTATYAFTLPVVKVQGVACYQATSTELYFYLSTSYGDVASKLYRVRYLKSSPTAQSTTTVFTGPAGMEDLAMIGSQAWTVSESGANYFQKRADGGTPWEDMYPFLFGIQP